MVLLSTFSNNKKKQHQQLGEKASRRAARIPNSPGPFGSLRELFVVVVVVVVVAVVVVAVAVGVAVAVAVNL